MATKKPTAKQIAARKLFAERARAGTLGGKRKANPAKPKLNSEYVIYQGNIGKVFAVDLTKTKAIAIAKHQSETTGDRFFVEHGRSGEIAYDSKYAKTRKKNPILPKAKSKLPANFPFVVEYKNTGTGNWNSHAAFKMFAAAKESAEILSKNYPKLTIRVMEYTGGSM